jgi:hypothetical protein
LITGFASVAMPLIGAGTGGADQSVVQAMIEDQLRSSDFVLQTVTRQNR